MSNAAPSAVELDFRALLDTAPDAIVVSDPTGVIRYVNAQTERLFGFARGELVGASIEKLVPARFRGHHVALRSGFLQQPAVRPMGSGRNLFGVHKDGHEVPIEISLSPHVTPTGTLVSAAIRDISDRRRRDEELRQAKADADKANAAKSDFLSSMSHELRTPLNAILGFAQLLQRDKRTPLTERQLGMLEHVLRGGEHLLRLIDEILDLSKIESGNIPMSPEPISLREILDEVATTLEPMAERAGVELCFLPLPSDLPAAFADRTRVSQILLNYGSNAIKYGRRGGRATVTTTHAGDRLRIEVEDSGIGIPLDQQDRIFQPFHRAGQETGPIEGTGIGLTITKRLAEMMGGAVGFASVPDRGSTFWVELPAHDGVLHESSDDLGLTGARAPAGEVRRHTLLYVEDNPANLAFMEGLVDSLTGVRLLAAPTGELGLELARAHRPDLIILDINLPGLSGYDALRRLREWPETQDIPVFALSASATERDVRRGIEAGFGRYLTKPVKVDQLVQAITAALGAPR